MTESGATTPAAPDLPEGSDLPVALPTAAATAVRRKGHRKGGGAADGKGSPARGSEKDGPQRRCIVSGAVLPKEMLIRFVLGPDGSIVPDLEGKLPGRGLWLSARRDMLETATRKRAFSKAARCQTVVDPDLAGLVEGLLRQRCLNLLGFARRAGVVLAGFDKVAAAARAGQVRMLVEATEGAEDGRRKIMAAAAQAAREGRRMPAVIELFTGAEMAAVLGREHVVHVAVTSGKPDQRALADRFAAECERLAVYVGQKDLPASMAPADTGPEDGDSPQRRGTEPEMAPDSGE
ncbi:RNA-binding protein [Novispirillum itersonii]|uniref:RNA-binding protein n=1 Tax=Novispirillum itersonii TaxID=189 RepID=UPI0003770018|nr:RNA-binding protein [Novispirillum itersonii]